MKEDFKNFVKQNPKMAEHVRNGETTWQNLYELYDLYGEKEEVWKPYIGTKPEKKESVSSFKDVLTWLKTVDYSAIEENINSVQRVIGVLQDLGDNKQTKTYEPRPMYKHFED
mgnify:CR=1 FL=1